MQAVRTDAEVVEDLHRLGHIRDDDLVLDATYGEGSYWRRYRPPRLVTNDIDKVARVQADFRALPFPAGTFDVVVLDPPYRLSGRRDRGAYDRRYGTDGAYVPRRQVHQTIRDGISEAARILRRSGRLILECQSQVSSQHVRWQDYEFTAHALSVGFAELVDRFVVVRRPGKQTGRQVHAHGQPTMLLVFSRAATP